MQTSKGGLRKKYVGVKSILYAFLGVQKEASEFGERTGEGLGQVAMVSEAWGVLNVWK